MIIKENALSPSIFNGLLKIVSMPDFPWFYVPNSSYVKDDHHNDMQAQSFFHMAIYDCEQSSKAAPYCEFAIMSILDSLGIEVDFIQRARFALIPLNPSPYVHTPHVDHWFPHTTGLLYLNDSDGDTIFYNERYQHDLVKSDDKNDDVVQRYYYEVLKENVTEMERVPPKANKVVIFDGHQFHASSAPISTQKRLVLNFTFRSR